MRNPLEVLWEKGMNAEPGNFVARGYARATTWGIYGFIMGLIVGIYA